MQYDYFISCETPDTVVLLEKWRDADALKAHIAQPHMTEIRAQAALYALDTRIERYE